MTLFDSLLKKYGYNEPIFSEDIEFNNYSQPWINKELGKLCASGELMRFEKGIYYIPVQTKLGPSKLNPQKVIEKKYIEKDGERIGFYSGIALLNRLGMSMQVPNVVEIYTNNEATKVRKIKIGCEKVILRRARTRIDKTNVSVQSFLELMNTVSPSFFDAERKEKAMEFIQTEGISRADISHYAEVFPDKAIKTLVESEVIYSVTQ